MATAVAVDDEGHKAIASELFDAADFGSLDAGLLAESWRQRPAMQHPAAVGNRPRDSQEVQAFPMVE
ncbi:hypothetical protein [Stenotrophomonas rhizophila]|uniref:hypothetical protein n=1 Tax=Stenotrophomonas rhizophila TaxID=216778 RepID=UPI000EAFE427|nr:hypothetical protein [Stenotrophomonas rhizophila]